MRKKSVTVRYTAKQIKNKIARGEDRTDWRKANAVTGKRFDASIRADPDDVREEPDWAQAVMGVPAPKGHINIRIDHDVLTWFKANGRGYQTLMNNVLRAFVKSRQLQRSPSTRRRFKQSGYPTGRGLSHLPRGAGLARRAPRSKFLILEVVGPTTRQAI